MKKYIIEIEDDAMLALQCIKKDQKLKSISKVVSFLALGHSEMVADLEVSKRLIEQYQKHYLNDLLKK